MLRLKKGINLIGLCPQIVLFLVVAEGVFRETYKRDCVGTSFNDGEHSFASLHWDGKGVDIRTHVFPKSVNRNQIVERLKEAVGFTRDFDIALEDEGEDNEHIHVEWQPKAR